MAANATEPAEDAGGGLRMKLEFSVWRKSFDRAHTAWSNAPSELKPALLLTGADLARAENWLVDFADKLSESERRFILKSKMTRKGAKSQLRHGGKRKGALYYLKVYSGPMLSIVIIAVLIAIRIFGPKMVDEMVEKSNAELAASRGFTSGAQKKEGSAGEGSGEAQGSESAASPNWPAPGTSAMERLAQTPPASEPPMLAVPTSGLSAVGQKVAKLEDIASHHWQSGEKDAALRFAVEALGSALAAKEPDVRAGTARSMLYGILSRKAGDIIKPVTSGEPATLLCPGGERILIASDGQRLQRWQIEPPLQMGQVAGRVAPLEAAAVDSACERIAVPAEEHTAEILSLATGRKLATLEGHAAPVVASVFSPDGNVIATASADKTVRLWDAASGRLRRVLDGHEGAVVAVAFSPDGRFLVTGSEDMTTRVWDARGGRQLRQLVGHTGPVTSIAFLGVGDRLLTASTDGTAAIWNVETGERLRQLTAMTGSIVSVAADASGDRVAAACDDGHVFVWQTAGTGVVEIAPAGEEPVRTLSLSPGAMLLTVTWDGTAEIWNAATGDGVGRIGGGAMDIVAASFRPDGERITALLGDGTLASWPVVESSRALLQRGREALPSCRAGDSAPGPATPSWCRPLVRSAD